MNKIVFKDSVLDLNVEDFRLLVSALLFYRLHFESLLKSSDLEFHKYYLDRIHGCDDLIDKFSYCI